LIVVDLFGHVDGEIRKCAYVVRQIERHVVVDDEVSVVRVDVEFVYFAGGFVARRGNYARLNENR
jgi:hypothetical protein